MRARVYLVLGGLLAAAILSGCGQDSASAAGDLSSSVSAPEENGAARATAEEPSEPSVVSAPGPVLSVIPSSREMSPGEVFTIYAGVSDDSLAVTFASSSPAVASVDEGGEVTAHSPGSAVVTVMAGGLAQRVAIEVKAPAPELVSSPEEESDKEDEPVYTAKAAEEIPAARKTESPEPGDEPLFYQEEIPPAGFSPDEYSRQVVGLINEERAAAGLTALLIDEGMMEAAAIRAREISKSFSHARPDGTRGGELAGTFGGIGWAAENIAMGPVTPAEAAYTWMTSEQGHRESILEPRASLTGAGCYLSDNNILYWVQLFAE